MIPAHALTTNQARPAHPSEPDLDSDAKMCYGFTHLVDGNKHFVSWDDRIRRQSPFIVQHAQVAVADSAILDLDVDFIGHEFAGVILKILQF